MVVPDRGQPTTKIGRSEDMPTTVEAPRGVCRPHRCHVAPFPGLPYDLEDSAKISQKRCASKGSQLSAGCELSGNFAKWSAKVSVPL
jgi:hypothetical protein